MSLLYLQSVSIVSENNRNTLLMEYFVIARKELMEKKY